MTIKPTKGKLKGKVVGWSFTDQRSANAAAKKHGVTNPDKKP